MKKSIHTQILSGFSILMLLIIVSQLVFNLFLARPYFMWEKMNIIEDSFYELKENYSDDLENIDSIAMKLQSNHSVQTTLLKDNEMIYSNGRFDINDRIPPMMNGMPNNAVFLPDDIIFSETPQTVVSDERREGDGTSMLRLTGKFTYDGEDINVMMTLPVASIDNSVSMFTKVSTAILAVAFLVGIIIAFMLSRSITSPIRSVERVAQNLSKLDFDEYADETVKSRELSSLAVSINTMSKKLKASIEELQIANVALQKDIDYQRQIEKLRRQFIANVSHEMKTPLGLLQIYSENLKSNVDNIDKDYYCDVIIEETNNLNEMVMSMLDISSIESGLSKMNFKALDFSELCALTVEKFSPVLEKCRVELTLDKSINVNGDEKYLEQAMKNYISNASNHTPDGGKIEISLKSDGKNAVFKVKNEGKNIAAEDMENIWTAFYKSDKARTRTQNNNAGLGLYIVKTIVEKHSGEYGVENVEGGVEFYFKIPMLSLLENRNHIDGEPNGNY